MRTYNVNTAWAHVMMKQSRKDTHANVNKNLNDLYTRHTCRSQRHLNNQLHSSAH